MCALCYELWLFWFISKKNLYSRESRSSSTEWCFSCDDRITSKITLSLSTIRKIKIPTKWIQAFPLIHHFIAIFCCCCRLHRFHSMLLPVMPLHCCCCRSPMLHAWTRCENASVSPAAALSPGHVRLPHNKTEYKIQQIAFQFKWNEMELFFFLLVALACVRIECGPFCLTSCALWHLNVKINAANLCCVAWLMIYDADLFWWNEIILSQLGYYANEPTKLLSVCFSRSRSLEMPSFGLFSIESFLLYESQPIISTHDNSFVLPNRNHKTEYMRNIW